ncbi:ATP-dependent DNA helicase RecG [Roseiconus lacunae]|uniref:Probable DNA 3'-5' helicase RecG n=1 Tax=Roseiconus lacunae TaxID=2605694 RepID=A0ABT7PE18_9BACT|nr:ATP-dependent DNA helicase RecG [Roseiconus lacunae]MDM4014456.1 ATP-dependent DNA helicase RecG [Roseiconus lacunae]WRQ49771.1 ATP-dependent DNA helicase RecG [Stieleria sp. HD01]
MTQHSSSTLTRATPTQFLVGVGPSRADRLARIGLRTAGDLLFCFPRDYEFPAPPERIDRIREGEPVSLVGTITDAELISRSPGKSVFGAIVENETGAVRLLFFNQPFRAEQLTIDRRVMISGEAKLNGLRFEFVHPKVTYLDDDQTMTTPQILPVYPLTEGVKQLEMRRIVGGIVDELASQLNEVLPESLRDRATDALRDSGINLRQPLPDITTAMRQIHSPDDRDHLRGARTRLAFQELLVMQLALAIRRRRLTTDLRSSAMPVDPMLDARITNRFPFKLTDDQVAAIRQISIDMSRQFPMNRLLQGDVGSGKTVVAIYAMMLAVGHGNQAVLMAPTEVLARQHYQTLRQILDASRVRIGLLCGSLSAGEKRQTLADTASGNLDLLVGTQALLHGLEFKRLGLCVIDEQHKFGVGQRVRLRGGGVDPHYLVMSATPIPRSVAMTIFGDTDLTTIKEKPPGRGAVKTYLGRDEWRKRWWDFVRTQLKEGRQAFVVAPRVTASKEPSSAEDASSEDVSSVESIYQQLRADQFSEFTVGLLHGRLSPDEKQSLMQQFAEGEIDVLVTTTVIEVGIDVPNATVMTIMGAERFGLAQLHQLRGRVSRGSHTGHVCVFTDGNQSPEEYERLTVFESTDDGFELAEADFKMRGPGDVFSAKQSGMPPMRIANVIEDLDVLQVARMIAQELVDEDPELDNPDLEGLKKQLMSRYGRQLELGDVA